MKRFISAFLTFLFGAATVYAQPMEFRAKTLVITRMNNAEVNNIDEMIVDFPIFVDLKKATIDIRSKSRQLFNILHMGEQRFNQKESYFTFLVEDQDGSICTIKSIFPFASEDKWYHVIFDIQYSDQEYYYKCRIPKTGQSYDQ